MSWWWAGRGTYDVCAAELFLSNVEHVGELVPIYDIGLDEDRARLVGVLIDELLCFWAEPKVCNDNIAILL